MLVACLAGYVWLFLVLTESHINSSAGEVCLVKFATNLPCPSCGSTRSVVAMMQGNFLEALYINPLGLPIAIIMLLTPLWIIMDLLSKRKTLFVFYCRVEAFLKRRIVAIPLILLVLINWYWNIVKDL